MLPQNTEISQTNEGPVNKEILQAFNTKKISDCSPRELDTNLIPAVTNAFKFIGKRDSESLSGELKFIYDNLPGELRTLVPAMRSGEISISIKRGLLKEFGEYYGINVAEILRFCKTHYESIERSNAAKVILKPIDTAKMPPSKESIFYLYKNNLIEACAKHFAGNNIEVNGPALYDFCNKLGLIIFSTKEKYDIMQDAAHALIKDQHNILFVTVEDYKRKPHKRIIELLTNSLEQNKPLPDEVKTLLIAKSKYLTLKAFFNDIEMNDLSLTQLIDSKKEKFLNEA